MNFSSILFLISLLFALFDFVPPVISTENTTENHNTENSVKKPNQTEKIKTEKSKPRYRPAAPIDNYIAPIVTHHSKTEKTMEEPASPNHEAKIGKSNSNRNLEKLGSLSKSKKSMTLKEHFDADEKPEKAKEVEKKQEKKSEGAGKNKILKKLPSTVQDLLSPLIPRNSAKKIQTNAVTNLLSESGHASETAKSAYLESQKLRTDLTDTQAFLGEVDQNGRYTKARVHQLGEEFKEEKDHQDLQHKTHLKNQKIIKKQGDQNTADIGNLQTAHQGLVESHENLKSGFNEHVDVNAKDHVKYEQGIQKNVEHIGELNKGLASQGARLTVNEAGLADLGEKHGKLSETVENHGGRLVDAEGKIIGHAEEISGLHKTDTNLGERIEGLQNEQRRFVEEDFGQHVENVNGQFKVVGKNIEGLEGRTQELARVQGGHGIGIKNLETAVGNEAQDRIKGDNVLSQRIIDETTPIREKADQMEATLGDTIDRVGRNEGLLGTHGEKLVSHQGRLTSAEKRLGENDVKFDRHYNRIQKRKRDILTIRQRFIELYGNEEKLATMQENIDNNMLSLEEEFASNLAQSQRKVEQANQQVAEANQNVIQTIENFLSTLRQSQSPEGIIGRMHGERTQLIRTKFRELEAEEQDRMQRKSAKGGAMAAAVTMDDVNVDEAANVEENVDADVAEQTGDD